MTDPQSRAEHQEREARRWELLRRLEAGDGDPGKIFAEMQELDAADAPYVGRVFNEVEADLALRRGAVGAQYDAMAAKLAELLPAGHPMRESLAIILQSFEKGDALDDDAFQRLTVLDALPPDVLETLRELAQEQRSLDAEAAKLDGDVDKPTDGSSS